MNNLELRQLRKIFGAHVDITQERGLIDSVNAIHAYMTDLGIFDDAPVLAMDSPPDVLVNSVWERFGYTPPEPKKPKMRQLINASMLLEPDAPDAFWRRSLLADATDSEAMRVEALQREKYQAYLDSKRTKTFAEFQKEYGEVEAMREHLQDQVSANQWRTLHKDSIPLTSEQLLEIFNEDPSRLVNDQLEQLYEYATKKLMTDTVRDILGYVGYNQRDTDMILKSMAEIKRVGELGGQIAMKDKYRKEQLYDRLRSQSQSQPDLPSL